MLKYEIRLEKKLAERYIPLLVRYKIEFDEHPDPKTHGVIILNIAYNGIEDMIYHGMLLWRSLKFTENWYTRFHDYLDEAGVDFRRKVGLAMEMKDAGMSPKAAAKKYILENNH